MSIATRLKKIARNVAMGVFQANDADHALGSLSRAPSLTCPLCGYHGPFKPHGERPRSDARCPGCKSLERQRLFKLYLDSDPGVIAGKDVLHFASEPRVRQTIKALEPKSYRTADLFMPADLKLNIEKIDLETDSVEVIVCHHVLEHVNDRLAMKELHRILQPGGVALLMVPIVEGWDETFEADGVDTPKAQLAYYGHPGHVRYYGRDFPTRLEAAGFKVEAFVANGFDAQKYGLQRGDKVFIARK